MENWKTFAMKSKNIAVTKQDFYLSHFHRFALKKKKKKTSM